MPASSMLAVGGSVLIAGLGWMLTHYLIVRGIPSNVMILLPGLMTSIAIVTTGALLIRTALNYLRVWK